MTTAAVLYAVETTRIPRLNLQAPVDDPASSCPWKHADLAVGEGRGDCCGLTILYRPPLSLPTEFANIFSRKAHVLAITKLGAEAYLSLT
jgi:hypothetical protein